MSIDDAIKLGQKYIGIPASKCLEECAGRGSGPSAKTQTDLKTVCYNLVVRAWVQACVDAVSVDLVYELP